MEDKYQVIYADPPWSYNSKRANYIKNNSGETAKHYPTLSIEDLKNLKVGNIADENCMLFCWATFPQLKEALELIECWGFKYKTVAFSWVKMTKGNKPAFGIGYYTRSNVEVCLLGTKGRPFKERSDISSVIMSPRGEHSQKPEEVRARIEALTGGG